jgi:hypothetical protein
MSIRDSVLFSGVNYVGLAKLTSSTTAQGFPVANAKTDNLYEFVKFTGTTSYIEFDLGTIKTLQLFGVLKHSFGASATWRIRLGTTAANTVAAPIYDSGVIDMANPLGTFGSLPWGDFDWGNVVPQEYNGLLNFHSFHLLDEPVQASYVRFDFSDTEGVQQFARAWMGTIYQPSKNALYGSSIKPIDTTKERQHESGRRTYGTRRQRRSMELNFELPESEIFYNIYGPLFSINGKKGEIVCLLQPLNPETWVFESVYGNITDVSSIVKSFWLYGTTQIILDERV